MSTPPHYAMPIEPWDFIAANGIGFFEGSAISYLCRWRAKGGVADLLKAKHYVEKLIALQETRDPPPPESTDGESETDRPVAAECVCPRVRSGQTEYQRCVFGVPGCRCHGQCTCPACCDEHDRATVAAQRR